MYTKKPNSCYNKFNLIYCSSNIAKYKMVSQVYKMLEELRIKLYHRANNTLGNETRCVINICGSRLAGGRDKNLSIYELLLLTIQSGVSLDPREYQVSFACTSAYVCIYIVCERLQENTRVFGEAFQMRDEFSTLHAAHRGTKVTRSHYTDEIFESG